MARFWHGGIALAAILVFQGCAFDIISVQQTPAAFEAVPSGSSWTLAAAVKPRLREGSAVELKAGTRWRQVGRIAEGDVYRTDDQVVTVEASNVHEAQIVVKDNALVGFYLPVERTFTSTRPTPLQYASQ